MAEPWSEEFSERYLAYAHRVEAWMDEKWGKDFKCPNCKIRNWTVGPPADSPIRPAAEGMFVGMAIPVVPIICRNCAYVLFIGGQLAGIPGLDEPAPTDKRPAQ